MPHVELLEARLEALTHLASDRTGLDLTADSFEGIARLLLEQEFGGRWNEPTEAPAQVLDQVARARLPTHWQLGRTQPGIVIWMVAPNIGGALRAAQPLIERGLEIRCVSIDVREVVPGGEWSIGIAEPSEHAQNWARADSFAQLLVKIANEHLEECPEASSRLVLGLEPASTFGAEGIMWAELGWQAAGGASIYFAVRNDLSNWIGFFLPFDKTRFRSYNMDIVEPPSAKLSISQQDRCSRIHPHG